MQPAQAFPFYSGRSPGGGTGDLHSDFTGGDYTSKTGFGSGSLGEGLSMIFGGALGSVHGVGFTVAPQPQDGALPVAFPMTLTGTAWTACFMQAKGDPTPSFSIISLSISLSAAPSPSPSPSPKA